MIQVTEKDKIKRITDVLEMIETVVSKYKLAGAFHKNEVEKYYLNLLQGKDVLNVYERRDAGVSDEKWNNAIRELYIIIGLKNNEADKDLF